AAVELCSLAFQPAGHDGNLMSLLIFGDGAGAAFLETGRGPGLEIVDTASALIPGTTSALGFDLTDRGFAPVLQRRLVDLLPAATLQGAQALLERHGLEPG